MLVFLYFSDGLSLQLFVERKKLKAWCSNAQSEKHQSCFSDEQAKKRSLLRQLSYSVCGRDLSPVGKGPQAHRSIPYSTTIYAEYTFMSRGQFYSRYASVVSRLES